MKLSALAIVLVIGAVQQVSAITCSSLRGTCKTVCKQPVYYWRADATGCNRSTPCCAPSGCVLCKAGETSDVERRAPCC
ncbi:hypothetical protein BKA70DRAFT_1323959 [Coprinopsis sp. MPI-PUGE-AT-0042]|nr:hypothetical protein BKA70DRAFT_1323959 [Coprinopsis sp. MPI-PUGE-AT-0042]